MQEQTYPMTDRARLGPTLIGLQPLKPPRISQGLSSGDGNSPCRIPKCWGVLSRQMVSGGSCSLCCR